MKHSLALALGLSLLAGCGGGGSGSSNVPGTAKTQAKTATGSVVISIPTGTTTAQTSRTVRYPQFVSPGASSVALSINGAADTLFDVSATSTLCTTVAGLRNCSISFGAPAGADTFAFEIFQNPNGAGALLATATSSQTIVAGQAFNFTVALNAAIGTLLLTIVPQHGNMNCPAEPNFVSQNVINEGCTGSAPVTIAVEDPSGAPITGSAPYAVPITFTTNDPTLTASPTQITAPGQTETVSYNGGAFAAGITNQAIFTATAGGQTAQTTFPIRRSYLYVANSNAPFGTMPPGNGNIAVYAYGATGNPSPIRTYQGGSTLIKSPIKPLVDATGNLYVLDNGIPGGPTSFDPTILVFGPTNATGTITAAPLRQISHLALIGANTGCSDMAFDPTGQFIFVSCNTQINVFPITANDIASNVFSTEFQDDSLSTQTGLAFDPSGDLYISDDSLNVIDIVAAPVATTGAFHFVNGSFSLTASGGSWPATVTAINLATDNSGTLYAPLMFLSPTSNPVSDGQAELGIWRSPPLPCNNCAPSAALTGTPFTTHANTGITLDPPGNVYVGNTFTNQISVFSRATVTGASASNLTPVRTIANTTSGATAPYGMAVGP
jgi:hypothetical protein